MFRARIVQARSLVGPCFPVRVCRGWAAAGQAEDGGAALARASQVIVTANPRPISCKITGGVGIRRGRKVVRGNRTDLKYSTDRRSVYTYFESDVIPQEHLVGQTPPDSD